MRTWNLRSQLTPNAGRPVCAHRRAALAVECALCAPLLILLAIACADFGRIAFYRQAVCNAARCAAESGATRRFTEFSKPEWEADMYASALEEMQNVPGFAEERMTLEQSTNVDADGLVWVKVRVSYPFEMVVAWPGLPSRVVVQKSIEFRQFR